MEKSTILSEMFIKKTRNSKVTTHKPVKSAFESMDDYLIAFLKYYNNPITLSCLKECVRSGRSKKMREFVEEYKAALIRLEQSGLKSVCLSIKVFLALSGSIFSRVGSNQYFSTQ